MSDDRINESVDVNESTEQKTLCSKCGRELGNDVDFCPSCGTPKIVPKAFCAKCGAELADGQEFCHKCGHKMGDPVESTAIKGNKTNKPINFALLLPVAAIIIIAIVAIVIVNGNKINSIELAEENAVLMADEALEVKYTILPEKKQNKTVKWTSSDDSIATVDASGNIIARGPGDCKITVSRGKISDSIDVHVQSKYEGNLARCNYQDAYLNATTDEEKEAVIFENLVAVESAFAADNLKDRKSFVLNDAYYDKKNNYLVLEVGGKNGFGATVTNYWLFTKTSGKWEYFCAVSDLKEEEYYSWDDLEDKIEKLAENLGRDYIKTAAKNGDKLPREGISRINSLFEEDKLHDVKLLEAGNA